MTSKSSWKKENPACYEVQQTSHQSPLLMSLLPPPLLCTSFTVRISHSFSFSSRPEWWESIHADSLGSPWPTSPPPQTAPRHGERRRSSFVSAAQRLRQRTRRAEIRENLGRWPWTPDSVRSGRGVHSQWAAESRLLLSLHLLWAEGNEPNQISPWLSITNGSDERQETLLKQAPGEITDSLALSPFNTCPSHFPLSVFLRLKATEPVNERQRFFCFFSPSSPPHPT